MLFNAMLGRICHGGVPFITLAMLMMAAASGTEAKITSMSGPYDGKPPPKRIAPAIPADATTPGSSSEGPAKRYKRRRPAPQ